MKIFGSINLLGLYTLILREQKRFIAVWTQTILAPLVSAGLLTVFSFILGNKESILETWIILVCCTRDNDDDTDSALIC